MIVQLIQECGQLSHYADSSESQSFNSCYTQTYPEKVLQQLESTPGPTTMSWSVASDDLHSVLRTLIAEVVVLSFRGFTTFVEVLWSIVTLSHAGVRILKAERSRFRGYLYHNPRRPTGRLPPASSLYRTCFGMRESSIRMT